jgi:hypothetical protein
MGELRYKPRRVLSPINTNPVSQASRLADEEAKAKKAADKARDKERKKAKKAAAKTDAGSEELKTEIPLRGVIAEEQAPAASGL